MCCSCEILIVARGQHAEAGNLHYSIIRHFRTMHLFGHHGKRHWPGRAVAVRRVVFHAQDPFQCESSFGLELLKLLLAVQIGDVMSQPSVNKSNSLLYPIWRMKEKGAVLKETAAVLFISQGCLQMSACRLFYIRV